MKRWAVSPEECIWTRKCVGFTNPVEIIHGPLCLKHIFQISFQDIDLQSLPPKTQISLFFFLLAFPFLTVYCMRTLWQSFRVCLYHRARKNIGKCPKGTAKCICFCFSLPGRVMVRCFPRIDQSLKVSKKQMVFLYILNILWTVTS